MQNWTKEIQVDEFVREKPYYNAINKKMTFIDFCSGIGGGRLGLESSGFKCIGFSEIDKAAIQTYKNLFDTNMELELGDLTKINPYDLPDFDLLISGFPCQSFSIVGKREGLTNKEKGQIIFYLAEILKVKKPKFFILENVKGLINHDKGVTLKKVLKILEFCGYKVNYKVLNSLHFNLAQMRERVYFVGVRGDLNKDISKCLNGITNSNKRVKISDFLHPSDINLFDKNNETFIRYCNNKYNKGRVDLKEILEQDFLIIDTRQSDLRLYKNKVPTLRRDRQGVLYVYKNNIYKLSAIEALKLQGFDKIKNLESKIKNLKTSDILRQCGNAMSVNVIEKISNEIMEIANG